MSGFPLEQPGAATPGCFHLRASEYLVNPADTLLRALMRVRIKEPARIVLFVRLSYV